MINYIYFESPDWRTFSCERLPVKPTAKDIFDTGILLAAKLRMYNLELSALKAKSVKVGNYEILEAIDHPNQNAHTLCFDGQWYVRYDEIIEWSGSVEIKKDVHCDEYHQHTKESCFVKVAILKLPETPIAMEQTKEQDAAHSFETLKDDELITRRDVKNLMEIARKSSEAELSRLRSELQQKDEIIKELIVVAARISMQLKKGDSYRVHIESLIKKANVF